MLYGCAPTDLTVFGLQGGSSPRVNQILWQADSHDTVLRVLAVTSRASRGVTKTINAQDRSWPTGRSLHIPEFIKKLSRRFRKPRMW